MHSSFQIKDTALEPTLLCKDVSTSSEEQLQAVNQPADIGKKQETRLKSAASTTGCEKDIGTISQKNLNIILQQTNLTSNKTRNQPAHTKAPFKTHLQAERVVKKTIRAQHHMSKQHSGDLSSSRKPSASKKGGKFVMADNKNTRKASSAGLKTPTSRTINVKPVHSGTTRESERIPNSEGVFNAAGKSTFDHQTVSTNDDSIFDKHRKEKNHVEVSKVSEDDPPASFTLKSHR